jgi:hypothetical protein
MEKKAYICIGRRGYDPEKGKHVKDPTLDGLPSLGGCMPHVRKHLNPGDHLFFISGKVANLNQFIMGGFEVIEKMSALEAYKKFPENRLRKLEDGQLSGNIIVNVNGSQHLLDTHSLKNFDNRIANFVIGRNPIVLSTSDEIARGRAQTMEILREIFGKVGLIPWEIIGRMSKLDSYQIKDLRNWLISLKDVQKPLIRRASVGSIITPDNRRAPQHRQR